jgi:hypothetical protein
MKLLYKPFGIVAGIVGGRLAQSVFKSLWARIDDGDPPSATTADASLPKIVAASAIEAATVAGIGAAVDRISMQWFRYLTGIWPGGKKDDSDAEQPAPVSAGSQLS